MSKYEQIIIILGFPWPFVAGTISVLGLILPSSPYLRSAKARFPLQTMQCNVLNNSEVESLTVQCSAECNQTNQLISPEGEQCPRVKQCNWGEQQ